jgi:hypothetical protein
MESLVSDWIVTLFQWVGVLFNFVFGLFLILSGFLVNVATTFNFNILSDSNAILKTGWLAARDIANLGFVILAIGSALATVLRYPPDYDVRRLLPKFVAAAILVNFSMTLAAIPIQFSNVLTGFFLSRVTSVSDPSITNLVDFSGPLVNILGPQKLLTGDSDPLPPDPGDSAGGAISAVIFASLATLIFNVIFTLLMAILLLAFAAMLISRYFILTFLIIFSPLACLAYIFPALKQYLGTWTNAYTKWVFIGPGMMFFVYMAITVAEELPGTALKNVGGGVVMAGLGGVLEQFINLSFITAILVMGLIAASKTGTGAGKMALGAANGIGNGTKKFFKGQVTKFTEKDTKFGQSFQKGLKFASEKLQVKEGDNAAIRTLKRFGAVSPVGQVVAVAGGHEKGIYGSLIGGGLVGAGIKSDKEKKPESKKDVEKALGDLYKRRSNMIKKNMDVKEVDEEIKNNERKLYRYRKEELEADYAQQDIESTNEAINKVGLGEVSGKSKERDVEEKDFDINLDNTSEIGKEGKTQKDFEDGVKKLTEGIKGEDKKVKETASREKIKTELGKIKEKIKTLKDLGDKISKDEKSALNVLQNAEYQLNSAIKKREEEIQILGSLRDRRTKSDQQFEAAINKSTGVVGDDQNEEGGSNNKKSGLTDQYGNPY